MEMIRIEVPEQTSETERHAAGELKNYVRKLMPGAGVRVSDNRAPVGAQPEAVLHVGRTAACLRQYETELRSMPEDGYAVESRGRDVFMFGRRGRGTLYAVYAFLERQGCRFHEPFEWGEVVPIRRRLELEGLNERGAPVLPYREMDLDCRREWNIAAVTRQLDWAVKNRLNTIGLCPRNDFYRIFKAMVQAARVRDLSLGIGAHQVFAFFMLPESWYAAELPVNSVDDIAGAYARVLRQHPDWFTGHQPPGLRDPCLSNPGVVARITSNVLAFLTNHPEFNLVHFKCSDGFDANGHCQCSRCLPGARFDFDRYAATKTHLEDVYINAVQQIARQVRTVFPDKPLIYTFLSTFGAPACYGGEKRLDDFPDNVKLFQVCLETQRFDVPLLEDDYPHPLTGVSNRAMVEWAMRLAAGSGRRIVLKEMLGSGNYRGLLRNAPRVVAANVRMLHKRYPETYAGSKVFANLLHQDAVEAWHAFGLNLNVHYRQAWHPQKPVEQLLDDYFRTRFGPSGDAMRAVCDCVEKEAGPFLYIRFKHGLDWLPVSPGADQSPVPSMRSPYVEKFQTDPQTLMEYAGKLQAMEACSSRLDEAWYSATDRECLERIALDRLAVDVLAIYLRYFFHVFAAGHWYKRALRLSESAARRQHLSAALTELKQAGACVPALELRGRFGYYQPSGIRRLVEDKAVRLLQLLETAV